MKNMWWRFMKSIARVWMKLISKFQTNSKWKKIKRSKNNKPFTNRNNFINPSSKRPCKIKLGSSRPNWMKTIRTKMGSTNNYWPLSWRNNPKCFRKKPWNCPNSRKKNGQFVRRKNWRVWENRLRRKRNKSCNRFKNCKMRWWSNHKKMKCLLKKRNYLTIESMKNRKLWWIRKTRFKNLKKWSKNMKIWPWKPKIRSKFPNKKNRVPIRPTKNKLRDWMNKLRFSTVKKMWRIKWNNKRTWFLNLNINWQKV